METNQLVDQALNDARNLEDDCLTEFILFQGHGNRYRPGDSVHDFLKIGYDAALRRGYVRVSSDFACDLTPEGHAYFTQIQPWNEKPEAHAVVLVGVVILAVVFLAFYLHK